MLRLMTVKRQVVYLLNLTMLNVKVVVGRTNMIVNASALRTDPAK